MSGHPGGVRLLLLADTHVLRRSRGLPAQVLAACREVDLVLHAGDWTDEATLDALVVAAPALLACWGNNDGDGLRARLPEVAAATVEGVAIEVVHETGTAAGRERRVAARHPDADVVVFGHSHVPWDTAVQRPDGRTLRLLNPGSPTDRRRQPRCTLMTATAADGGLSDVRLVPVDRTV